MAGTGLSNTGQTVELSKLAMEAGAESLLVVTPPYVRPNTQGLLRHYETIGAEVGAPICLYHVPSRTGRRMTVEEFVLLAQVPEGSGNGTTNCRMIFGHGPLHPGHCPATLPLKSSVIRSSMVRGVRSVRCRSIR